MMVDPDAAAGATMVAFDSGPRAIAIKLIHFLRFFLIQPLTSIVVSMPLAIQPSKDIIEPKDE